jgi:hypothetical protein
MSCIYPSGNFVTTIIMPRRYLDNYASLRLETSHFNAVIAQFLSFGINAVILTADMNITKNHMNNQFGLQYCFHGFVYLVILIINNLHRSFLYGERISYPQY